MSKKAWVYKSCPAESKACLQSQRPLLGWVVYVGFAIIPAELEVSNLGANLMGKRIH